MATYTQTVRRGLPRQPGGDPWPPGGDSPIEDGPAGSPAGAAEPTTPAAGAAVLTPAVVAGAAEGQPTEYAEASSEPVSPDGTRPTSTAGPAAGGGARRIRRGLPRVPGGEPWPPAASVPASAAALAPSTSAGTEVLADAAAQPAPPVAEPGVAVAEHSVGVAEPDVTVAAPVVASVPEAGARPLRRGLPRMAGGDPWPPAGFAPAVPADETHIVAPTPVARQDASSQPLAPAQTSAAASGVVALDVSTPLPFTRTVWAGAAARERAAHHKPAPKPEPERIGPFTRLQWAGAVIVGGGGLLFAAGMAVLAVRFLLSLEPFQDFLATYPGEYPLPEGAPVGIPPWLGWQHFFNVFLMVLIIRSGLQVRTEKRPTAFWSPRSNGKRKISLNLWFHQSLDILWIVNGVIFIVLLFATGQWMKLVPTSWAVFPNALSAALQYVSLDWPTENGWVNYNSLQQLAYFATVFLAAPLAIATGVRMSGIWPKNATAVNNAYPVEWARAIHFPVMLYFVAFIIVHVALVLATGAMRNLNHMYASQDVVNWVGFWIFLASLVVIAVGWVAARPLVLAPIARLFGKVSAR